MSHSSFLFLFIFIFLFAALCALARFVTDERERARGKRKIVGVVLHGRLIR